MPNEFVEYLTSLSLADHTIRNYRRTLRAALSWAEANDVDLTAAKPTEIAALAKAVPYTCASRGQLRSTLNHYWRMLDVAGYPGAVKVPPPPDPEWNGLEDDDLVALLKVARAHWPEGATVLIGAYTGARRTEIATSAWQSFDPELRWVRIMGKGSRTRWVPVDPTLRAFLRPHQEPSGYLFPGRFGGHITPATVWAWVRRLADEAGIGLIHPHQLRHSFAQKLYDGSEDPELVAEMMGHRDLKSVRIYTKVRRQRKVEALRFLDWERQRVRKIA